LFNEYDPGLEALLIGLCFVLPELSYRQCVVGSIQVQSSSLYLEISEAESPGLEALLIRLCSVLPELSYRQCVVGTTEPVLRIRDVLYRIRFLEFFILDPGSGSQKFSSRIPDPTVHKKRDEK
jgi:hypothetical protein